VGGSCGNRIALENHRGICILEWQPLAKMEGANTYYYHNDHLATPKDANASGAVVWSWGLQTIRGSDDHSI